MAKETILILQESLVTSNKLNDIVLKSCQLSFEMFSISWGIEEIKVINTNLQRFWWIIHRGLIEVAYFHWSGHFLWLIFDPQSQFFLCWHPVHLKRKMKRRNFHHHCHFHSHPWPVSRVWNGFFPEHFGMINISIVEGSGDFVTAFLSG